VAIAALGGGWGTRGRSAGSFIGGYGGGGGSGWRRRQRRHCRGVAGAVRAQGGGVCCEATRHVEEAATARRRRCAGVTGAVGEYGERGRRRGSVGAAAWRVRALWSRRGRVRVAWARARAEQAGARPGVGARTRGSGAGQAKVRAAAGAVGGEPGSGQRREGGGRAGPGGALCDRSGVQGGVPGERGVPSWGTVGRAGGQGWVARPSRAEQKEGPG